MSDVKKREKSRLFLGLGPKHCVNGEVIYTGENTWEKAVFMRKIQSSVSDVLSLKYLFYNQVYESGTT